jgi:hypothetical protein
VVDVAPGKRLEVTRLLSGRTVEPKQNQRMIVENVSFYWFIGYHQMTSSHIQRTLFDIRDRMAQGYNQRWAYVTVQANVTAGWMRPERTEAETEKLLDDFIRQLGPLLKRPDGTPLF